MLDVGFSEIFLVAIILLLVVGPERMPRLAYLAGKWFGKAKVMVGSVKNEIDKEVKAEELKEILAKQQAMTNPLEDIIEETSNNLMDAKQDIEKNMAQSSQQIEKSS